MHEEEKNRIEDLKQSIYSRNAPDVRSRRKMRFNTAETEMKRDWEHPVEVREDPVLNQAYEEHMQEQKHGMSFFTKLFIGSALFCVIAVGAGAYIFFNGGNFISGNNIDIKMSGPISVAGGTPVSIAITVTNNNSVALKTTDMVVHFPAGATDPRDTTQSLEDYQVTLGDINPGESVTKNVEAVIFGEENLQKTVKASVTYNIVGSSSVFTKEKTYDVLINSSPLVLSLSAPKETTSGQPFDLTVNVKSNSTNTLKNILLKGVYPFGYNFVSSSLKPASSDNTAWAIGDIAPGATKTLVIRGALSGEDSDLRAFHFSVGAKSPKNPLVIGTTFMESTYDLTIKKPSVSLAISVNNDTSSSDYTGQFGKAMNVNVKWANNLPETLSNVVITVKFSGTAYDKSNVNAVGGYFRSATNEMIWNQQTSPELASVAAGASGMLTFSIVPSQSQFGSKQVVNPTISMSGNVVGDRPGAPNFALNTGTVARNIRITSDVSLSGRVVRTTSAIMNSGPIPPVAEQKTTYTVVWSVDNTSNTVGNAIVTATLPPYVTWTGVISPATEDISFDKNAGQITWNIGNVNTFTSGTFARREVAFQVSFEPSIDQVGQVPIIINQATLTATDNWTKGTLQDTQGYLTSSFSTDPSFKYGDETVAKPR